MSDFVRKFDEIGKLKEQKLFQLLKEDITKGEVFPAIRNDYISFYYKGGGLFQYKDKEGFSTHIKYAFIPKSIDKYYVNEKDLKNIPVSNSFTDSYSQIKERCKKYGTIEAEFVSKFYKNNLLQNNNEIILLDTEIAFKSNIENEIEDEKSKTSTNRIDMLLYSIKDQKLVFCEAKHFSNSELWAKEGNKPQVVDQIERYNEEINKRSKEIIEQYKNYIKLMNELFNTNMPEPRTCHTKTGLLIMGYDSYQSAKIDKLLKDDGSLTGINYYSFGKGENITQLYNSIKD